MQSSRKSEAISPILFLLCFLRLGEGFYGEKKEKKILGTILTFLKAGRRLSGQVVSNRNLSSRSRVML